MSTSGESIQVVETDLEVGSLDHMSFERKRNFNFSWGEAPQPWGWKTEVLISNVTEDEFFLGQPKDSLLHRRRIWNRETNRGQLCDPDGEQGSKDNQTRFRKTMRMNKGWRGERDLPLQGPETFKAIEWNRSATVKDIPLSPRTIPSSWIKIDGWRGTYDNQGSLNNDRRWRARLRFNAQWMKEQGYEPLQPDNFAWVDWTTPAAAIDARLPVSPTDTQMSEAELMKTDMSNFEDDTDLELTCVDSVSNYSPLDCLLPRPGLPGMKTVEEVSGFADDDTEADSLPDYADNTLMQYPSTNDSADRLNSLMRFIIDEVPGISELSSSDDEADSNDPLLGTPIAIPPRGSSLMNRRMAQAEHTTRTRRSAFELPRNSRIPANEAEALRDYHTDMILPSAAGEIGTATAVQFQRPPPVRMIVVRGRAVRLNQGEGGEAVARWEENSIEREARVSYWQRVKSALKRGLGCLE